METSRGSTIEVQFKFIEICTSHKNVVQMYYKILKIYTCLNPKCKPYLSLARLKFTYPQFNPNSNPGFKLNTFLVG